MSAPIFFRMTLTGVLMLAATGFASELDDLLNQKLRGAWAVLAVEVYSGCAGTYSDNQVSDAGVTSKARYRFEPGELVKVDKLNAKRQRVDLMLSLDVPLRTSRRDGPFELFDDLECQVQLIVPISREDIKSSNDAAVTARFEDLITFYPSLEDARESDAWNGREIEPLPADYDHTLARYAVWKAEQTNAAIGEAVRRAIDDAADVADSLSDDAEYLEGFGEGAEAMTSFSTTDCSSLLGTSFAFHDSSPPKTKTKRWRDGWRDGQELIFNILLAERLQACRVQVPPIP